MWEGKSDSSLDVALDNEVSPRVIQHFLKAVQSACKRPEGNRKACISFLSLPSVTAESGKVSLAHTDNLCYHLFSFFLYMSNLRSTYKLNIYLHFQNDRLQITKGTLWNLKFRGAFSMADVAFSSLRASFHMIFVNGSPGHYCFYSFTHEETEIQMGE